MGRLEGKVALVTGASRGIGAAVARRFAAEGAAVALNHVSDPDMAQLAQDVAIGIERDGGRAIAVEADVSDPTAVTRMVETVAEEFGDVDVLITNAATSSRGSWIDASLDDWSRVFAVNVQGALLCAQSVYPGMLRRGGGSIVTVSSVMAHLGMVSSLPYVSSKAALVGFTRALAREIGADGIRVNCVMPGAIRTESEVALGVDEVAAAERAAERQSLTRRGYAEDLAGTFLYLASADSDFVTGQVVAVDGGWVNR